MARRPPCLAALSGQPPEPGGSRRKARGVDGESACRATMVSGHYAANVTTFFLIPLFPLKFPLRLFNRSKAEPFCFCDTRRINLYPVCVRLRPGREEECNLKPFEATQGVRLPPGKGAARQPEASLAWAAATQLVKRRRQMPKPCGKPRD